MFKIDQLLRSITLYLGYNKSYRIYDEPVSYKKSRWSIYWCFALKAKEKRLTAYAQRKKYVFYDKSDCFHFWYCILAAFGLLKKWILWDWRSRTTLIQLNNEVKTRTTHNKKVDNSTKFFFLQLYICLWSVFQSRIFCLFQRIQI